MFSALASLLRSPFLLFLRLYLAYAVCPAGLAKLQNLDGTAGYFASLAIPQPQIAAILCGVVELVGSGLFGLGAASPLVSLALVLNWSAAMYFGHQPEFNRALAGEPQDLFKLAAYQHFVASMVVFLYGPGKLALDALIGKTSNKAQKTKQN
jgi:uncharacterized membrane protein YphA (DoxX/SURF4 family)